MHEVDNDDWQTHLAPLPRVSLSLGQLLLRQGDSCDAFLILMQGEITVHGRAPDGRELELYRIQGGNQGTCVLTTACLLGGQAYPAEARVTAAGQACFVPAGMFHALLNESAAFRRVVFASYAERLSGFMTLVHSLAFDALETRLATYVLQHHHNLALEISHQQLADALGTAREVVSRQLKKWELAGLVRLKRNHIDICQLTALERLSSGQCDFSH